MLGISGYMGQWKLYWIRLDLIKITDFEGNEDVIPYRLLRSVFTATNLLNAFYDTHPENIYGAQMKLITKGIFCKLGGWA